MPGEPISPFAKVSMVIPCYWLDESFFDMTVRCLNSVNDTTDTQPQEVFIVDDGSPYSEETITDNTDFVQHYTMLHLDKNGGYAHAVNAGLFHSTGDYIIVSNNDIIFMQPDWLDHLLRPLTLGYGISSIRTTDSDGWQVEDRLVENGKFGSIWAITREAYETLGPLDERFHNYFEDLDYWHRARVAGIKIVKNHAGIVEHAGKATIKAMDPNDTQWHTSFSTYKEKWGDSAHLIEHMPGSIVLLDDYELQDMPESERAKYLKLEVSFDNYKQRIKQHA